jgi:hypothetical protein
MAACGPRDRLAGVKQDYPGASEYLSWNQYVLIRFPVDRSTAEQRGILLQRDGEGWVVLGESAEGFQSLREVMTYIPEMDESGVSALKVH